MRFLLKRSPETKRTTTMMMMTGLHLAPRCCCQLSAATSLCTQIYVHNIVVTCNYHEYCYVNKKTRAESDYPLSNTESAERGVKRGILRNRNERCAVADVFLQVVQVESKSSRWFGKGATSSIVTADVDIPDKVLEKRIHLAEVRAKRKSKAFLLRAFWASRAGQSKSKSSETKWEKAYRWVSGCCCWYLRSSSQGFLRKGRVPRVCSNCRGQ
jgi:hypothetical protein